MKQPDQSGIQTIFCAVDFSATADLAIQQSLRLVRRHGARLVLAHLVDLIDLDPHLIMMEPGEEVEIERLARRRIDDMVTSLRGDGFDVDALVELGNPGPELVSLAKDGAADLIVIGTRGLTGFKHLRLGSIAEYVLRRSHCPVLTIHPEDALLGESVGTVILPTDLSANAEHAAQTFIRLVGGASLPKIILAYADRTPPYMEPFRHDTLARMGQKDVVKEKIEQRMEPTLKTLRGAGFDVKTAVLDGDPVSVITKLASRRNAEMIVMCTRGRSPILSALLGRTAQRIVQHAPCPVLTVPPKEGRVES